MEPNPSEFKNIIDALKSVKVKPDPNWQKRALNELLFEIDKSSPEAKFFESKNISALPKRNIFELFSPKFAVAGMLSLMLFGISGILVFNNTANQWQQYNKPKSNTQIASSVSNTDIATTYIPETTISPTNEISDMQIADVSPDTTDTATNTTATQKQNSNTDKTQVESPTVSVVASVPHVSPTVAKTTPTPTPKPQITQTANTASDWIANLFGQLSANPTPAPSVGMMALTAPDSTTTTPIVTHTPLPMTDGGGIPSDWIKLCKIDDSNKLHAEYVDPGDKTTLNKLEESGYKQEICITNEQ